MAIASFSLGPSSPHLFADGNHPFAPPKVRFQTKVRVLGYCCQCNLIATGRWCPQVARFCIVEDTLTIVHSFLHPPGLASECEQRKRGHLPGHSQGRLEPGPDPEDGLAEHPGSPDQSRALRPAGAGRWVGCGKLRWWTLCSCCGAPKTCSLCYEIASTSSSCTCPQDAIVARQYIDHPEQFWAQAKLWTDNFALEVKGFDALCG